MVIAFVVRKQALACMEQGLTRFSPLLLVEEYCGAEENTVKGAAVVEWWNGPRGMWFSD